MMNHGPLLERSESWCPSSQPRTTLGASLGFPHQADDATMVNVEKTMERSTPIGSMVLVYMLTFGVY